MAENAAAKQPRRGPGRRFRPGQSGNPAGKRKGTRHRATMLAERLLDGEAETVVGTVIEKAKQGDMMAYCLPKGRHSWMIRKFDSLGRPKRQQ